MNRGILIVGTEGLLGGALLRLACQSGLNVSGTTLAPLEANPRIQRLNLGDDLTSWSAPRDCAAAFLCAGITSLDACRHDPPATRHINVIQTLKLTERLVTAGVFVVFPSSNLVFDGTRARRRSDEMTCPMTEYGRQKAEVESGYRAFGERVTIVRLTKVINPRWRLIQGWIQTLRSREPVEAFGDLGCAPIPLELTARGLLQIAERQEPGIWQFSAESDLSYSDLARHFARRIQGDESLVTAVSSVSRALEHSPRHTTLDITRATRELGLVFPEPLQAIEEAFRL